MASQLGSRLENWKLSQAPALAVASGQGCTVLLIKPLSLPAMWE